MTKVVAITGPTASGKSKLAVELALEFNGEINSADSRQIYKGLDISTGKVTDEEKNGIPHHLIDIADLRRPELFSLSEYLNLARKTITDTANRGKLPIIAGGTGLYVTALVEGYVVPEVRPNKKIRKELEKLSLEKLQDTYHAIDPEGFKKIDISNPRRLIRAIEVVSLTKKPFFEQTEKNDPGFETLVLGIDLPFEKLKERISIRLFARIRDGMLEEIKRLHQKGISWERLENFGLEQKWMRRLADEERKSKSTRAFAKAEQEILKNLEREEIALARRQLTWWRNKNVVWVKNLEEAINKTQEFLN